MLTSAISHSNETWKCLVASSAESDWKTSISKSASNTIPFLNNHGITVILHSSIIQFMIIISLRMISSWLLTVRLWSLMKKRNESTVPPGKLNLELENHQSYQKFCSSDKLPNQIISYLTSGNVIRDSKVTSFGAVIVTTQFIPTFKLYKASSNSNAKWST